VAVVGSCNINDRSMLGNRDSEIAVIISDNESVESVMNGASFQASKFALSLRLRLMRCHLGISLDDPDSNFVLDPVADTFWNGMWLRTANTNSQAFATVFATHIPEECTKLIQLSRTVLIPVTDEALRELRATKGFLIKFPTKMLTQEFSTKETTPSDLFGMIYL